MTFVLFVLILGVTIFVHELGHFIFAKKAGIYVYEFALGMGPRVFSKKRKNDETIYSIRAIPLGGFVQMAGEEIEDDKNIPQDKKFQSKTWMQKFFAVIAGVMFNFIFAFIILFFISLVWGFYPDEPIIDDVVEDYPAVEAGIEAGDEIVSIDGRRVSTWDDAFLYLALIDGESAIDFEISRNDEILDFSVLPVLEEVEGEEVYMIGIYASDEIIKGFFPSLKYTFLKMGSLFKNMFQTLQFLFTGELGLNNISGPVGIYGIVGDSAEAGIDSLLFLLVYLSVNVGVINLLPVPAFDGGRVLFLLIELVTRKKVPPKVENIIHAIGFIFLIGILLLVTFNDVIKLFK